MENVTDLEKIETLLKGREVRKTKHLYDSVQKSRSNDNHQPQEIIANLTTQLKVIHKAETIKQPINYKRNNTAKKSLHTEFVNINMLSEDEQVLPDLKVSSSNKFETQCFSDTQLINEIEKAEAINVEGGLTQEFHASFQGNKDYIAIENKEIEHYTNVEFKNEVDNCHKSHSLMEIDNEEELVNETKDATTMSMVPNVSNNNENFDYLEDIEMPSSPVLQCSKPTERHNKSLVFNLESFEKFESIAVPVVKENLNKSATKRKIISQMVDRELFLNINLEPFLLERDKLNSPVISLTGNDIFVKNCDNLNQNDSAESKESEKFISEKKSDSLKDEILFSSDEDEDYAHKNPEELSFTCALENSYHEEPDNLNHTMYVGFQTASDKSIQICTNSFKKAKNIFNDIDPNVNKNNSFTELVDKHDSVNKKANTSRECNVNDLNVGKAIFNKCCDNNVKNLDIKPSERFKTASNKVIKLSEKALSRCLKVFKDIDLEEEFINIETQENCVNNVIENPKALFSDNACDLSKIEDDCLLQEFKDVEMFHNKYDDKGIVDTVMTNCIDTEILSHNDSSHKKETNQRNSPHLIGFCREITNDENKTTKIGYDKSTTQETNLKNFGRITDDKSVCLIHGNENAELKFQGFKTVTNKLITVSEKALENCKTLFEDFNNLEDNKSAFKIPESLSIANPCFKGFQTASNKRVIVSKKALEKCKKVFEGLDNFDEINDIQTEDDTVKNKDTTSFKGFQTASKKPVIVSEEAFEKSRKFFLDLDGIKDESLTRFIKSKENAYYSDKAAEIENKLQGSRENATDAQTSFVGFKLASNKAVNISKEALEKSKNIFQDTDYESNFIETHEQINKNPMNFDKVTLDNKSNEAQPFVGFRTASNKDVKVSAKAYTESNNIFKDIFMDAYNSGKNTDAPTTLSTLKANGKYDMFLKSDSKFQCFQTVSNKKVNISEAAIKESKKIFDDLKLQNENENKDDGNSFRGFQTASNRKVQVSVQALAKAKSIFDSIDSDVKNLDSSLAKPKSSGLIFQTGNKKQVTVSEDSLNKVRNSAKNSSGELKTDLCKPLKSELKINVGFRTGNNRNVKILEEALYKSRKLLDNNPTLTNQKNAKTLNENITNDIKRNDIENLIDTQVLNNFEQTLNTEDLSKTPTPVSKRSGSPILSCPKAKRRKIFETPYCKNKNINKVKPINIVKPNVHSESKHVFTLDYKKSKRLKLTDIVELENGNNNFSTQPHLKYEYNNLLNFEFIDNRNDLTDSKTINVEGVKHIFLDNVDHKIVPNGWIENHMKLILWKLISYEIKFPNVLSGVCTAKNVINQLKYRYDRELHKAERPALRKILEKDDIPGKTMVLSIVAVYVDGVSITSVPQTYTTIELELTDGWYTLKATVDRMLVNLIVANKIKVGGKLVTNGAELVNCEQGVAPWENTSSVRLKLFGNSTRRARWHARLGYHGSAAILTQLSAVKPEGGKVSKIRVFIARVYPTLYVEKFEDGSTVTRSERLENLHEIKHENERQAFMEKAYEEVEREFSDQSQSQDSDIATESNRKTIETGSQIAKFMKKCNDPAEFRSHLSDSQLKLLQEHTTKRREKLLQDIQTRVLEKINKDGMGMKRNVVTLVKIRIVGLEERNGDVHISKAMMSIWKPSDAILEIVSEGSWIEVLNVVPTSVRYSEIQISAGRQSIFKKSSHKPSKNVTHQTKLLQRTCFDIKDILHNPTMNTDYNEIDTIGMIFLIEPSIEEFDSTKESFQNIYLTDADKNFICVNFWGGIKKFGYESLLQTRIIVACINLQKRAGNSRKSIPQYRVTEYTYFTKTPKDSVARKMITVLENKFLSVDKCKFCNECVGLKNNYAVLKSHNNIDNVSPYRFNNSDYNFSRNKIFFDSPLTTVINRNDDLNLTGLDFESTFKQETQELSPKTLMRKKKVMERIEKLKRYGEPPPISPITIINKSKNAASAFKSPLLSKSDSLVSVADEKERNLPNRTPKTIVDDRHEQSSPILKLNRTYVKKSVNPVKLNFDDSVAMKENDSGIDHFAAEFECSPPLSLD